MWKLIAQGLEVYSISSGELVGSAESELYTAIEGENIGTILHYILCHHHVTYLHVYMGGPQ